MFCDGTFLTCLRIERINSNCLINCFGVNAGLFVNSKKGKMETPISTSI